MIWFAPFEGFGADDVVIPFPGVGRQSGGTQIDDPDDDTFEAEPRVTRARESESRQQPQAHIPRCSIK